MNLSRRKFLHLAAGAAALPFAPHVARAQDYPIQPVRILVGFVPGVAPDITARMLADKFSAAWGKPVVVENVSGAGGNIATERVARAAPDGHTLLMGGNSSLIFSPSMYDKLAYDPIKDFAPITQVFVAANMLVVHNDVPARTLPELIALARAQPGKLTYAHAGAGTSQHLAAELLKSLTGIDIQPVAYRGTTALLPDLLAGRVTMSSISSTWFRSSRGQAQGICRHLVQALGGRAGAADHGRIRLPRLRGGAVVRPDG